MIYIYRHGIHIHTWHTYTGVGYIYRFDIQNTDSAYIYRLDIQNKTWRTYIQSWRTYTEMAYTYRLDMRTFWISAKLSLFRRRVSIYRPNYGTKWEHPEKYILINESSKAINPFPSAMKRAVSPLKLIPPQCTLEHFAMSLQVLPPTPEVHPNSELPAPSEMDKNCCDHLCGDDPWQRTGKNVAYFNYHVKGCDDKYYNCYLILTFR